MNEFKNPSEIFNAESINQVDQLASPEEALTFSEQKETIKNNIQELKIEHNALLSDIDDVIDMLDKGLMKNKEGLESARYKSHSLKIISSILDKEKDDLKKMTDLMNNVKETIFLNN